MGLFDKKAGGTFVGNLIRAAASNLTGGVAGQGANMINADGSVGNGTESDFWSDLLAGTAYNVAQTEQGSQLIKDSATKYTVATTKNNWIWLAIIGLLGTWVIILTTKK